MVQGIVVGFRVVLVLLPRKRRLAKGRGLLEHLVGIGLNGQLPSGDLRSLVLGLRP